LLVFLAIKGSLEDRGIATWQVSDADEDAVVDMSRYNEGYEVYNPLLPQRIRSLNIMKYIPFLPHTRTKSVVNGV
jgi:hypothetical protein